MFRIVSRVITNMPRPLIVELGSFRLIANLLPVGGPGLTYLLGELRDRVRSQ